MAPIDKDKLLVTPVAATAVARGSGGHSVSEFTEVRAVGTSPGHGNHLAPLEEAAQAHSFGKSEPISLPFNPGELRTCFDRALSSMFMAYQPIVWAHNTESVFGYEALLRPNDPDLPHPGAMLEVADRLDRLQQLGRAIRLRVAEMYGPADSKHGLLFVNLHATDLLDPALISRFAPLAKLAPRVVLEITERSSLEGMTGLPARVKELRDLGYQIAIDDFGAGHSRMKLFSPEDTDYVKLDMSLVREIDKHVAKQQLVASISSLCRDQGIKVVGEGVESDHEADALIDLGVDLLQGFLIGRPAPHFTLS